MFWLKEDHQHRCYVDGDKHNLKPRYDEKETDKNPNKNVDVGPAYSPAELRELYIIREYIGDICTWCGKTIKRIDMESP